MAQGRAAAFKHDGAMPFQMGGRSLQGPGVGYDPTAAYFQQPTYKKGRQRAPPGPTQTRPGYLSQSSEPDVQNLADLLRQSLQQAQSRQEVWCGSPNFAYANGGAMPDMPSTPSPRVPLQAAAEEEPSTPPRGPPLPWKLMGCGPPPGLELSRELKPKSSLVFDDGASNRSTEEALSANTESSEEDFGANHDKDCFHNFRHDGSMPRCGDDVHALMIKHLPCRCTKQEVLNAIAEAGYADQHNFFYLPLRRGYTQNFGYAFIGFATKELAASFSEAMTGYSFKGRSSAKACEIATARIQGVNGNADRLQKNRCLRKKVQPKLASAA